MSKTSGVWSQKEYPDLAHSFTIDLWGKSKASVAYMSAEINRRTPLSVDWE